MASHARDGEHGVSFPDSVASGRLLHWNSSGIGSWGWGSFGFEDKSLMFLMMTGLLPRMKVVIKSIVMFSDDLKLFCVSHFVMFGYKW